MPSTGNTVAHGWKVVWSIHRTPTPFFLSNKLEGKIIFYTFHNNNDKKQWHLNIAHFNGSKETKEDLELIAFEGKESLRTIHVGLRFPKKIKTQGE